VPGVRLASFPPYLVCRLFPQRFQGFRDSPYVLTRVFFFFPPISPGFMHSPAVMKKNPLSNTFPPHSTTLLPLARLTFCITFFQSCAGPGFPLCHPLSPAIFPLFPPTKLFLGRVMPTHSPSAVKFSLSGRDVFSHLPPLLLTF